MDSRAFITVKRLINSQNWINLVRESTHTHTSFLIFLKGLSFLDGAMTFGMKTLKITTLRIQSLDIKTFRITFIATLSITSLNIMILSLT